MPVFKTGAFNRSATPPGALLPRSSLEIVPRLPVIECLGHSRRKMQFRARISPSGVQPLATCIHPRGVLGQTKVLSHSGQLLARMLGQPIVAYLDEPLAEEITVPFDFTKADKPLQSATGKIAIEGVQILLEPVVGCCIPNKCVPLAVISSPPLIPITTSAKLIGVGTGEPLDGAYDVNSIPNEMHDLAAGRDTIDERNTHGVDGRLLNQACLVAAAANFGPHASRESGLRCFCYRLRAHDASRRRLRITKEPHHVARRIDSPPDVIGLAEVLHVGVGREQRSGDRRT